MAKKNNDLYYYQQLMNDIGNSAKDAGKEVNEVKEHVNEVKDTINVLAEDANIAGAKVSKSFDDISSSADDTYDSIDELLGITREQFRDAIKGIEELDDSFGILSDKVKNIGYVDLSDLEFASVDTDKLKELQEMTNKINDLYKSQQMMKGIGNSAKEAGKEVNKLKSDANNIPSTKILDVDDERRAYAELGKVFKRTNQLKTFFNAISSILKGSPVDNFKDMYDKFGENTFYGIKKEKVPENTKIDKTKEAIIKESIDGISTFYKVSVDDTKILRDEQRKAIEELISAYNAIKDISIKVNALNSTQKSQIINSVTGDIREDFLKAYNVERVNSKNKIETGADYAIRNGWKISIDPGRIDKITPDNSLFEHTANQRLHGFKESNGDYVSGYIELNKEMTDIKDKLIKALPILSTFSSEFINMMDVAELSGKSNEEQFRAIIRRRLEDATGRYKEDINEINTSDINEVLKTESKEIIGDLLRKILDGIDIDKLPDEIVDLMNFYDRSSRLDVDTSNLDETKAKIIDKEVEHINGMIKNIYAAADTEIVGYMTSERNEQQIKLKDSLSSNKNKKGGGGTKAYDDIMSAKFDINNAIKAAEDAMDSFEKGLDTGNIPDISETLEYALNKDKDKNNAGVLELLKDVDNKVRNLLEGQYAEIVETLKDDSGKLIIDINDIGERIYNLKNRLKNIDTLSMQNRINSALHDDTLNKNIDTQIKKIKDDNDKKNNATYNDEYKYALFSKINTENYLKQREYLAQTGLLKDEDIDKNNKEIERLKDNLSGIEKNIEQIKKEASDLNIDISGAESEVNSTMSIISFGMKNYGNNYIDFIKALSKTPTLNTSVINSTGAQHGIKIAGNEESIEDDVRKLKKNIEKVSFNQIIGELEKVSKNNSKVDKLYSNILDTLIQNLKNDLVGDSRVDTSSFISSAEIDNAFENTKNNLTELREKLESLVKENNTEQLNDELRKFQRILIKAEGTFENLEIDKSNTSNYTQKVSAYKGLKTLNSSIGSISEDIDYAVEKDTRRKSEAATREAEQALKEREQVLREEHSIRSKLEKQAQEEAEQTLKKTENKVKEVCSTIVNTIKKTISNIIGIIRKLNTLLNKSINLLINGFRGAFNTIRRIITLFGNFGNRIKTVSHNGNILKGTFTELKSKIDLLIGAFRSLFNNEFLQNGMKLLSSVQTLNMLIGKDLTAKTIDWANNLEKGFGLSASGLIQNLQSVSSVLYGMGMSSENVYNAGRNLEALGMTMSSITGLDFDTVITKIDSGMKGMTQSIDDLGLSVRESQMDAFLQKLKAQGGEYANIGTKFSNLTEDQRVYVRYAAIMDQFMSKEAFSAESYARSLNTLTGQMSILKQQVQQLKSTIGTLVLKLFAQIIKPLTYIVYLANLAVKKIAALFGINLDLDNTINELGGGGIDTSGVDGLTDSLNETADAAEDAKGGLSALDHITSLNTSKSNSGAGADAFDYSKLANYNDNYADMLEDLGKMNNDYIEQCRQALIQMLKDMEKRVGDWFKRLTGRVIDWDVVEKNFGRSWENIKNTFTNLKEIFKNVFDTIGGLLGSVLDDLDFSTLFEKFTRLISYLTKLGAIITKRLQPYIQKFYDDYLSPYVVKFGDWLEEHLDKWIHKTEEWLGGWESHKYDNDIKNFFENTLPEKFNKFVESVQNAKDKITELKNFIKGGDSDKTFIDVIKEKYEFLRDNVLTPIKDILDEVKIQLFDKNGDHKVNLEDAKISLGEIKDKIKEVGDYLSKHKEEIATLLASAVTFIVELGKIKLTIFEELFNFMVEHADTIKAVCDAVINLINFAVQHPVLAIAVAADLSIKTALAKAGIDIVFNYFKEQFKYDALIKLMGLGKTGEVAKAGKEAVDEISKVSSEKIDAACSELETKIISTVKSIKLPALVLAIAFGWGGLESLKTGWEDIVGKDGKKLLNVGAWNTLANDELQRIADNFYNVLRKTYGTEIPKAEIDNALAAARSELERTGKYTAENINLMMSIIEEDLYEDIEHPIRNLANTGDFDAIANHVKVVDDAVSESSGNMASSFDNISGSTDNSVSSLDSLIGTYDELNGASGEVVANNNNVKMSLDELVAANSEAAQSAQEHKDTVSELREQINKDLAEIGTVSESTKSRIDNMARSMGADFYAIRLSVSNVTNTVNRLHQALMNLTSRQWKVNFRDGVSTSNIRWASDSGSRIGIKGFGFANGGVPKSGSLFFANENGNTELVGNFGGYSGVANQDMIIQAIKEAAVQNSNGTGTVINNNFNIGNMLGTDADFRKLVNKVTQVQRQQNHNIANGSFVMA